MRITLAIAVICLAMTACGGSSADPDVSGEAFDGLVTLSDVGSGAQRTLRYTLAEGDLGRSVMTFAMSIDQEFDGMPLGTQRMEYSILAEYEVMAITDTGDYRVATRFVEVDAEPLLQDAMDMMIGLEVNQTISPRGEIRDVSFVLPSGLDPTLTTMLDQMAEQMDDLAAPLPLEPVGVGATWSHSATTDLGGYEATMLATYEVTGFDGELVLLSISLEAVDFGEEMTPPGMPPGTKMSITELEQTATGMNELDLTQPFVSSISMTTTMFMKIHVEADGQSGDLEQTMTMEMTVSEE